MKRLILFITVIIANITLYAQSRDSIELTIRDAVIIDSVFMEKIDMFTKNDSIIGVIRNLFIPGFDLMQNQTDNKIKSPYLTIIITKRRTDCYKNTDCNRIDDIVTDSLTAILNCDSLTHVILRLDNYKYRYAYETNYKGKNYYFAPYYPIESYILNERPIFKPTGRLKIENEDSKSLLLRTSDVILIPLIYYHDKLYIDPDSLQWNLIHE